MFRERTGHRIFTGWRRQAAGEAGTKCCPQKRGHHGHGTSRELAPDTHGQTSYFFYTYRSLKGVLVNSWGEHGIFYNPGNVLKRGVYVLTVKEKDGDNDKSSNLDRENVYRVNIGVRKKTFIERFGDVPKRPAKGCTVDADYDFSAIDRIIRTLFTHGWGGYVR